MDPASIFDGGLQRVSEALKGNGSIVDAFAKPEQKEIIDRVTGMMSLLEGHADVVMDGVGPSVIPSVDKIRTITSRSAPRKRLASEARSTTKPKTIRPTVSPVQ